MRVLFISRLYPNKNNTREGAVIHSQALVLSKKGIKVHVLSPLPYMPKALKNFRSNWNDYYSLPDKYNYEGITVYHPRYFKIPFGLYDNNMDELIIKSIERVIDKIYLEFPFDIVHTHMGFPDSSIGVYLKSKYKVPLICSIRTSDTDLRVKNNKIQEKIKYNLSFAEKVISPSIQISKKVKKYFDMDSIHIGNGIYPEKLQKETEKFEIAPELRKQLENKKIIISVSNLIERKGIKYNILAVSELVDLFPNILYIVIGDGPEKSNLEKLVSDLNLNNNVLFLGDLEHKDAMQLIKISDIFSMPSWRETFGLVYLEAMYFKKPVILCEGEALDGAITHNLNAITVPKKSINQLVNNMKILLDNNKLNEMIGNEGETFMKSNYTWNIIGEKLIELYNSYTS